MAYGNRIWCQWQHTCFGNMWCWFESSYPDEWCIVHRRSAKLLRSTLVQLYKTAVIVIRCTDVVQGSIPYCSILRQYLMRYLLLIVRNNKMRQSQLAVQSNGKRGFDSYYCYKIKGEANDYIIIYYYVVHQSTYSIVGIAVGY